MNLQKLALAALCLVPLFTQSACDPTCSGRVEVNIRDGKCYQIDVTDISDNTSGTSLSKRLCSSDIFDVPSGKYRYTASFNGETIESGTQTIGCYDKISMTLGTTGAGGGTGSGGGNGATGGGSGTTDNITVRGRIVTFNGDPFFYCQVTNPRPQAGTITWTQYSYTCASQNTANTPTVWCTGTCTINPSAVATGAGVNDPSCFGGFTNAQCSAHIKY